MDYYIFDEGRIKRFGFSLIHIRDYREVNRRGEAVSGDCQKFCYWFLLELGGSFGYGESTSPAVNIDIILQLYLQNRVPTDILYVIGYLWLK